MSTALQHARPRPPRLLLGFVHSVAVLLVMVPLLVTAPADASSTRRWIAVSAGGTNTCGIQSDGTLHCWGSNQYGQNGDDLQPAGHAAPSPVGRATWKSVSAGFAAVCGLRSGGSLFCWGSNLNGQVGDGTTQQRNRPVQIGTAKWRSVSVGGGHVCGIRDTGALYCWGANTSGQLGQGGMVSTFVPLRVGSSTSWTAVESGNSHTCGMTTGRIYCWGDNISGQLGDGTTDDRLSPRRVGTWTDWAQISAGGAQSCAVRSVSSGRRLYCWGENNSGELGDGSGLDRLTPRRIGTSESWISVSAGYAFTCGARTSARAAYCTGANSHGQLGDGTTSRRRAPVREARAYHWRSVAAGYDHACAIREESRYLYCWGAGEQGQVGDGHREDTTRPTRVEEAA